MGTGLTIGIPHIEYVLPGPPVTIEALAAKGLLDTPVDRLRSFGFEQAYVSSEPPEALALAAARRVLETSAIDPLEIGAIFYAGSVPGSHAVGAENPENAFNYPVAQLQYELGLEQAAAVGVSQVGCMGLFTAVRLGVDFLHANPGTRHVLCVSADVLSPPVRREMLYNVISDGACALVASRDAARNRLIAHRQVTKGYYWNSVSMKNEIIAAYFPTARNIVRNTLAGASLTVEDISWIIPHNVSRRSWDVLLRLLEIPTEKLFAENIRRMGHVIAADNWINLKDASDRGHLRSRQKILLFNFGFGANWSCMVLEH